MLRLLDSSGVVAVAVRRLRLVGRWVGTYCGWMSRCIAPRTGHVRMVLVLRGDRCSALYRLPREVQMVPPGLSPQLDVGA